MIKSNELRIGNWINFSYTHKKVITRPCSVAILDRDFLLVNDKGDYLSLYYETDSIQPIPLSGELLVKCGFEKRKLKEWDEFILPIGDDLWVIQISIANDDKIIYSVLMANGGYDDAGEKDLSALCKYLHQLQNLYFALTNTELPINLSNQ